MEQTNAEILKTKQHYDILDGLRGIAALSVVTFHFMEFVYSDYSQNFIGHGFLAVDFFFCLSGFVIGYAYDDRVGKMGVLEFFKSRIIRLHPLVIFGSLMGIAGFYIDSFGGDPHAFGAGRLALYFITSLLLIPMPTMAERYFNLFSFNAPAWSLFWEYVANIVYALVLYKLARKYLLILTVISGIALCYVGWHAGNLMGGWGKSTFWDGSIRIAYSFMAGLLVYRSSWIIKNKLGFIGVGVMVFLTFVMPFGKWNWLTEPLVVLFYYPLIIALGAGAVLAPGLKKLCVFAGNISYPLYMTHYAGIWLFAGYYVKYKPVGGQLALIVIGGLIVLVAIAYLVMVIYDMPLRKYLNSKRKKI
jgi:peptidoglycan/LPS O-acetylase OafA/YrhL